MTRLTIRFAWLGMVTGLLTGTASAVGLDSSPSPGVAYGVLICSAVGDQLQVQLFDSNDIAIGVSRGTSCVSFIADLKANGFQVGEPVTGFVVSNNAVPNDTESLVWEVQGTR